MDNKRLLEIIEIAKKSNKIHVTNNNSKCGPACLCVNFPTCVCRSDAPCKKDCYCNKGRQVFKNVLGAYYRNLLIYNNSPVDFFNQLDNAIKFYALPLFRFFDAGDIPNYEFLKRSIDLAKNNPDIKFLMYTKKYEIVNTYLDNGGAIPSNMCIRFSTWGKGWNVPNPYNLPLTYINFSDASKNIDIPKNAFSCKCDGVTCSTCKMCFNNKVHNIVFNQH